MARSARYTVDETLGMLLGGGADEFASGDEDDIIEDPEFPLPTPGSDEDSQQGSSEDCEESSGEGMYLNIQKNTHNKYKQHKCEKKNTT